MELTSTQRESAVPGEPPLNNKVLILLAKITILASLSLAISIPNQAHAGIFSKMADFFTSDAKADVIDNGQNSQNIHVLEAKMAMATEEKKEETPVKMTEDNVLIPEMGALGTALDVEDYSSADQISIYITKNGDTLSQIAEMYNVSVNTIVWANEGLNPKAALKEGTSLLIMPISGVTYTVRKGDTLNGIAKKYEGDALEIARFNGVTDETLIVGEDIIVPNGEMATPKKKSISLPKVSNILPANGGGNSYYRYPVIGKISQGIHDRNAVDIATPTGTPVVAAASGKVIVSRSGWNGGYGNYVVVTHDNGSQTLYAHLSSLSVSAGQYVNDGQIIGKSGNTGRSTGPHLHFEIRGTPGFANCVVRRSCR